jgi:hypothetical protein
MPIVNSSDPYIFYFFPRKQPKGSWGSRPEATHRLMRVVITNVCAIEGCDRRATQQPQCPLQIRSEDLDRSRNSRFACRR